MPGSRWCAPCQSEDRQHRVADPFGVLGLCSLPWMVPRRDPLPLPFGMATLKLCSIG